MTLALGIVLGLVASLFLAQLVVIAARLGELLTAVTRCREAIEAATTSVRGVTGVLERPVRVELCTPAAATPPAAARTQEGRPH